MLFIGWLCFWTTFWTVGHLLPYDQAAVKIVPKSQVYHRVSINMAMSLPYSYLLSLIVPKIKLPYCLDIFGSIIVLEIWFTIAHYLLHSKYLYNFHKLHHKFYIAYPIVAMYCSYPEALFCNMSSVIIPALLFDMNLYMLIAWSIIIAIYSLALHSSILNTNTELFVHQQHHKLNQDNYGFFGLSDYVIGKIVDKYKYKYREI